MYALQTYFFLPHPTIHPSFLSFFLFYDGGSCFFILMSPWRWRLFLASPKKKKKELKEKKTPNLDLISLISYQVSSHLQVRS